MDKFAFALGSSVSLVMSNESGVVKARAEYADGPNAYLVLYRAADGRQVEGWWQEGDLTA